MTKEEYAAAMADQAVATLLWSETIDLPADEDGVILSTVPREMREFQGKAYVDYFGGDALPDDLVTKLTEEIAAFVEAHWKDLRNIRVGQAGHDYILSRNETGAGFNSHDDSASGARLAAAACQLNPVELYLGDDLKIYSI